MKTFRFPLQAVLTVRQNQENKALEAYAFAQAGFEKIAARFRRIHQEIEDLFDSRRAALKAIASSEDMQHMQQGMRALQETARLCQTELDKAQAMLEEKSRELLRARQGREVVEKVHQRQFARHQLQVARQEQRTVDDLATLKSIGEFALKWR